MQTCAPLHFDAYPLLSNCAETSIFAFALIFYSCMHPVTQVCTSFAFECSIENFIVYASFIAFRFGSYGDYFILP